MESFATSFTPVPAPKLSRNVSHHGERRAQVNEGGLEARLPLRTGLDIEDGWWHIFHPCEGGQHWVSPTSLQHDLLVYETDDDLARHAAQHLAVGLEADEAVLAVTSDNKRSILRDALGSGSAYVTFLDVDEVYTRPEDVLARYDSTLRTLVRDGAPAVRLYGELSLCDTPAEWEGWISYEAILNRAFADRPVSILCGYDARVVPETVVAQAYQAHTHVVADDRYESPDYREPEDVVRELVPPASPLPAMRPVPFADERAFKERLAYELMAAGVPQTRAREVLLAAVEVLSNANYHGNGVRMLRVGGTGDSFVCEISDYGPGLDDPLAGYVPPRPGALDAAGLWLARQLTSRLELVRTREGHCVRLWV